METWTGAFPQLLAAYEHKERFYGIWDATTAPGRSRPGRVDSHHPEGPKGSLERSGQGSGKLARRDHDLLRDGHARHQRLHGVHQPTGKDKNREGRGYSFEVMRARMLYTTKHKKKAPTAKVSPFYKKTIGYGLPDFAEELNYGVDLSTI